MAINPHGTSNADASAPGGLHYDNIMEFDMLPERVRSYLANAITCLNAVILLKMIKERQQLNRMCGLPDDSTEYAIRLIVGTERATHKHAVTVGVVPNQKSFDIRRVREESPIDVKKRQRLEDAGERRLRAIRKRNSAERVQTPEHAASARSLRVPP